MLLSELVWEISFFCANVKTSFLYYLIFQIIGVGKARLRLGVVLGLVQDFGRDYLYYAFEKSR